MLHSETYFEYFQLTASMMCADFGHLEQEVQALEKANIDSFHIVKAAVPKQYLKIREKMILTYSFETLLHHPQIDGILIVADEMWQKEILLELEFHRKNLLHIGFLWINWSKG